MRGADRLEPLVGALVLAAAVGFFIYGARTIGERGAGRYELSAAFGRVDGVGVGAEVRVAGVPVGAVTAVALDPETFEAELRLAIDKGVVVPDDSLARILTDGLLGGAFVSLEPGGSETPLKDGEAISATQGSVDLLGLAIKAFTANSGDAQAVATPGATEEDVP
jgi:phospholipid/cholesterol/gamma-HCH transport system substrate-binding protein